MRKLIPLVLILFVCHSLLQSQSFITIVDESEITLDSDATSFKRNLFKNNDSTSYFLATFDSIENHIDTFKLDVKFSDSRDSFMAYPNRVYFENENDYLYNGLSLDGQKGISISSHSSGKSGMYYNYSDTTHYYFLPFEDTLSIFLKKEIGVDSFQCGNQPDTTSNPYILDVCDSTACLGRLTVLFLFPEEVVETELVNSNLELGFFETLKSEMGGIFGNSLINHRTNIKWDTFTFQQLKTELDECQSDAQDFCDDSTVDSLRTIHKADILIYLAPDYVDYVVNGVGPFACVAEFGPIYGDACIIMPFKYTFENMFTYTHEVGHLYGAQHIYDAQNGNGEECAFSKSFYISEEPLLVGGTVMALKEYRIPYFSDPEIEWKDDFPIGEEAHNAAGRIRMNGCILQNFKPEDSAIAFINLQESQCSLALNATVLGTGSFTYKWEWSYDGLFSPSFPGDSVGVSLVDTIAELDTDPCKKYFLKLSVFQNGVEVASDVRLQKGGICSSNPVECDDVSLSPVIEGIEQKYKDSTQKIVVSSIEDHYSKYCRIYTIEGRLVWEGMFNQNLLSNLQTTGILIIVGEDMKATKFFKGQY